MNLEELEAILLKPKEELFFKSHDPRDHRLGEIVSRSIADYNTCRYALVSCSQDQGVQRNNGRPGSAQAPMNIRQALYRYSVPAGVKTGDIMDLGDTSFDGSLEEIHERHHLIISKLLKDGKTVIVLGGGNDLSYPDVKAVQKAFPGALTINVDTHLDIRINPVRNSGTPYRQLIDEKIIDPRHFFEIGYQSHANSQEYILDAQNLGFQLLPFEQIGDESMKTILEKMFHNYKQKNLFLGFDMDAVNSSCAPGVSATSSTGLTAQQAYDLVGFLIDHFEVKLLEITEVNPLFDLDERTSKLAAKFIHRFLENNHSANF